MKIIASIFLILIISLAVSPLCAESLSSAELINNARQYDGKTVSYEGEVIGEVMLRGQYAWVSVNDGRAAISIWVDKESARQIIYAGDYRTKGDWVAVTGIFNRACPVHGGDLDIHAAQLRRSASGKVISERLNTNKRNLAGVLLGLLCLVLILRPSKRI